MAKDDYYTLVAKILVYLYKKYKQKDVEEDYISPLTDPSYIVVGKNKSRCFK